jgi:hypothetical protein
VYCLMPSDTVSIPRSEMERLTTPQCFFDTDYFPVATPRGCHLPVQLDLYRRSKSRIALSFAPSSTKDANPGETGRMASAYALG